jgi:hypothetical protein
VVELHELGRDTDRVLPVGTFRIAEAPMISSVKGPSVTVILPLVTRGGARPCQRHGLEVPRLVSARVCRASAEL